MVKFFNNTFQLLGKKILIGIPFGWFLLFFLAPFLIILKISFAELSEFQPPYTEIFQYSKNNFLKIFINLKNYSIIFQDDLYFSSYLNSVRIAATGAFLTLLVGYPLAMAIASSSPKLRYTLILFIVLPSWTSFLIRVYAWIGILKDKGLLNGLLGFVGIDPIKILHTESAMYVGIVYVYLPFMVFPIYSALVKADKSLVEAAYDLGCGPIKTFFKVTLPLSMKGVIAGFLLCCIPAVGEFIIPELLGSSYLKMTGTVIWTEFFNNRDWPRASALAILMLLILTIPIVFFNKIQQRS